MQVRPSNGLQLFDRAHFLDIPWKLEDSDPSPILDYFEPPMRAADEAHVDVDTAGIRRDAVDAMVRKHMVCSEDRIDAFTYGPMLRQWGVKRLLKAFDRVETESGLMTEDYSFCARHRACGGSVWAAAHHFITHVGPHGYSGRFADVSAPVFRFQDAFFVDPNPKDAA